MAVATAAPLSITATDRSLLIAATKEPVISTWSLPALTPGPPLRLVGADRPRIAGLCVGPTELVVAPDWSPILQLHPRRDGTPRAVTLPTKRTGAVRCSAAGLVLLAFPDQPSTDPDAAGTGPGIVILLGPDGAERKRHTPAAGAAAIDLASDGRLALLDNAQTVWIGTAEGELEAVPVALSGKPRAVAFGPTGVFASSTDTTCRVGGACAAVDGGAGLLAAGQGWVAVGGFDATTVLDAEHLSVRATLPGRPAGLHALADGTLLRIVDRAATILDPSGTIVREVEL
ncbi:MAG TPA: hypothetical protein ENK18_04020 [Deltaproteobacteria bacterium]|nr:hypothetical protein [Deltaproteobacteria bacterium]